MNDHPRAGSDAAPRNTGIKVLGPVPWGTHFCQLYRTRRDLLDILVPYFKAGLADGEFCMWICSPPLTVEEAKAALRKAVPDLAAKLRKKQIEILPYEAWYLAGGRFNARRVLRAWSDRLEDALARGLAGLRLSANTFWLEKKDWKRFTDYEAEVDAAVRRSPILALCTYSLDRVGVHEIVDVLNNHKLTLIRREGRWTLVESSVRRTVESDLERSQQRFREIFEESPIGIELYDAEGRLVEVNRAALDIFGVVDAAEVRGFRLFQDPNLSRGGKERLERGHPVRYEGRFDFGAVRRHRLYRTRHSGLIDLDVLITPIGGRGRSKGRSGYLVQVQDITGRKRTEGELDESRRKLQEALAELETRVKERTADLARAVRELRSEIAERKLTERSLRTTNRILDARFMSGLGPFVILDRNFNFVRVNEAYARSSGRKAEDLVGRNHFELFPDPENEAIFRRVVRRKKPFRVKAKPFQFPEHPEWGVTYWDWTLDPVLDDRGRVEYLVFALNDVTQESRAHEQVRRNEALLRTVLDTVPVGVWITDKEGRVLMRNPAGLRIWAGSRDIGLSSYGQLKGWRAGTGEPLGAEDWPGARALVKGETVIREEIEIEGYDGARRSVLFSALPIRDASGAISGAVIFNEEITERLEEERRAREQAALLELAADAIIVRDANDVITYWNRGAEVIYGWPKREAIGREVRSLLRTKFPEPLAGLLDRVRREGHWQGELVHRTRDGRALVVESRWAVLGGREGTAAASVLEINRDITARKSIEEALRRSSFYTRGLIEASLDPLVAISPAGKITDVNKATELVTGLPRAALVGSDFSDYFTEPAEARAGYEKVFSEGSVRDYPLAIRHVSGAVTEVLYNAVVFKDEAGSPVGVFAAARDITALKAAEQERLRLATAIEQIKDGVSILDLEGRILSANPAFAGHHGFRPAEVLGRFLTEVLGGGVHDPGIVDELKAAAGSGKPWSWHFSRDLREGGGRELDLTVSPIRDASGRPVNLIAVERDVTQEVIFQERIRQWQKMEALGTLAGGIAHDLNNLLLPILINTELALGDLGPDAASGHRLEQVLEAARRGQDMVKQIIAFAQHREQERRPVDLVPVIRESLDFLRVSLPKNIRISERLEAESAVALADPTQIHQVLVNLGSNAAHAMRGKGGVLEVGLAEARLDGEAASQYIDLKPGAYLRLTVRDTGHGMPPEIADRIFEPFFTTKRTGEGTGMGLAVVHGIIKGHEGSISVLSEPGKGAVFTILLPRVVGPARPAGAEPSSPYPKGTERVLFVDDEDIQVRAMGRLLEHLGYKVVGLTDGRGALEAFRRDPAAFDLAILDQTMPHLSGAELARELLALRPDLPIIMCTGYSDAVNEEQALAMGIRSFMLKPFSARDIAVAIRRVLARKA